MRIIDGVRVESSIHAARRALSRVPVMRGASQDGASYWLEGTAARALIAGRKARRAPAWCTRDDEDGFSRRAKAGRTGTMRFVWNDEETAALLVCRKKDDRGSFWLVVTVLVPVPALG